MRVGIANVQAQWRCIDQLADIDRRLPGIDAD